MAGLASRQAFLTVKCLVFSLCLFALLALFLANGFIFENFKFIVKHSPGLLNSSQKLVSSTLSVRTTAKHHRRAALVPENVSASWASADAVWGGGSGAEFAWPKVVRTGQCNQTGSVEVCHKSTAKFIILFHDKKLFGKFPFIAFPPKDGLSHFACCDGVDVLFTTDRQLAAEADIVEFNAYAFPRSLPERAHASQAFMAFTVEAPYTLNLSPYKNMNLVRTFSRDADVMTTYVPCGGRCACERLVGPVPLRYEDRRLPIPMSALVSNCNSQGGREKVLRYLMDNMEVHSMGKCFHNINGVDGEHVLKQLQIYLYAFAVENAVCKDYVTEKFFRSLAVGSVPVVVSLKGRPAYDRYAPNNQSFIDLAAFPSLDSAIKHLKETAMSKDAYMKYHQYRRTGNSTPSVSANFVRNVCNDQENEVEQWCNIVRRMRDPAERDLLLKRFMTTYETIAKSSCLKAGSIGSIVPK